MTLDRSGSLQPRTTNLVDILDRVLDKGLVVAGDIRVALANVELLTVRIRLLVCSIDKAEEIGLDWWRHDNFLTSQPLDSDVTAALQARVEALERRLAATASAPAPGDTPVPAPTTRPTRRTTRQRQQPGR
jgi:hypothetical protein